MLAQLSLVLGASRTYVIDVRLVEIRLGTGPSLPGSLIRAGETHPTAMPILLWMCGAWYDVDIDTDVPVYRPHRRRRSGTAARPHVRQVGRGPAPTGWS